MPERNPKNFGTIVKDSLINTVGFEGAVFSILTDIDPHNKWSPELKSSTNKWHQAWIMAALVNSLKVYLFVNYPESRFPIMAYEGIVLSAMLIGET